MKNRGVGLGVLAAFAVIVLTGSAYQLNAAAQGPVLRYQSGASFGALAPFEVAEKLGYYRGTGVKIRSVGISKSGPEDVQALAAGSIDIASTNSVPVINAVAAGLKIVEVASAGTPITKDVNGKEIYSGGILVHKASGIKSARDLVGKKVSINSRGAQAEFALMNWLDRSGVSINDVVVVILKAPHEVLAVQRRLIDAAYSWYAVYEKAQEDPNIEVLTTTGEMLGDFSTGGYVFTREFLAKNPELVREFTTGFAKAWDWSWDNPRQLQGVARGLITEYQGNTDLAELVRPFGKRKGACIKDSDIELYVRMLVRLGRLKEGQVKPSDIYTNEFNSACGGSR